MSGKSKRFTLGDAFMEFIRHPSPFVLLGICLSFWAYRLSVWEPLLFKEWVTIDGVMMYWPFQEWWMHKYLLHLPPIRVMGREIEMDFAEKHRLHHEKPTLLPLIFLPVGSILGALVLFSAIAGVLGGWSLSYIAVFMGTASFSTMLYEWTHYLTHSRYSPQGAFYKRIWRQHRWHHYKNEHYWYSFTIPHIDSWMNTGPDVAQVPKSNTARTLGRTPVGESQ